MKDNLFLKIIRREIPADILYEDDACMAFRDIRPQGSTHFLVIPKKPIPSLRDVSQKDKPLMGHLLYVAHKLAAAEKISEKGYRVVINCGEHGGQEVYHLHLHVIGGRAMAWPPG